MLKGFLLFVLSVASLAADVKEERVEHAGSVFRVVRLDPAQVAVNPEGQVNSNRFAALFVVVE